MVKHHLVDALEFPIDSYGHPGAKRANGLERRHQRLLQNSHDDGTGKQFHAPPLARYARCAKGRWPIHGCGAHGWRFWWYIMGERGYCDSLGNLFTIWRQGDASRTLPGDETLHGFPRFQSKGRHLKRGSIGRLAQS